MADTRRMAVPVPAVAAVILALALALAPTASASAFVHGFTWYTGGGLDRSGPPGTTITAFATEARPNTPFRLISVPVNQFGCEGLDARAQPLNPSVRYSSASGFISATTGAINRPPGRYFICFYEATPNHPTPPVSTYPLLFTVG